MLASSTAMSWKLSASFEISFPYQAVYQYLLDNLVSRLSFVSTVIVALYSSNISMDYADRMQIRNHQSWAEQLEDEEQNTPQINMPQCHNKTNSPLSPHTNNSNHSVSPPDLELLAISY